jgi:hypothetical protein
MATAVCGGAESGSRASFQTVPGLKVNRDSRLPNPFAAVRKVPSTVAERHALLRADLMQARSGLGRPPTQLAILGAVPHR